MSISRIHKRTIALQVNVINCLINILRVYAMKNKIEYHTLGLAILITIIILSFKYIRAIYVVSIAPNLIQRSF